MFPPPQIAPPAPREQLLTAQEVAEWMRVSPKFVYQHSGDNAQQPVIPSVRVGSRSRRFDASAVERFIRQQTSERGNRAA